MFRIIDLEGETVGDPSLLPERENCLELFRWMLYLRAFDEEALSLQRAGRITFCNPSTGQEANQIGTAAALSPDDWVFPSYRVAGVYLYRKGSPLPLLNQLYGNSQDLSRGRQLPMHFGDSSVNFVSVSSPVGTQITQAVGLSLAAQLRKLPTVAIAYFGDGATSTNDFHAGLNLAGVLKTPTVFYCENNQYAFSVPMSKQTASESIAVKGVAYGVRSVRIDGNDVFAVRAATLRAVESARCGDGPTLIEAVTYRRGLHSTADEPALYRARGEAESWEANDPVSRCREYLRRRDWWSAEWEDEVRREMDRELKSAIEIAESQPPPPPESMFEDVWAEMPSRLREQMKSVSENP